jgi:hypothetical protein
MKVIGIDVVPRRGGHVLNGQCAKLMSPAKLEAYLRDQRENVLIALDTPLTGQRDPDGPTNDQDLTIRNIEKFFRKSGPVAALRLGHPPWNTLA